MFSRRRQRRSPEGRGIIVSFSTFAAKSYPVSVGKAFLSGPGPQYKIRFFSIVSYIFPMCYLFFLFSFCFFGS